MDFWTADAARGQNPKSKVQEKENREAIGRASHSNACLRIKKVLTKVRAFFIRTIDLAVFFIQIPDLGFSYLLSAVRFGRRDAEA